MNKDEVLRIVDAIQREKSIDKEVIFQSLEQTLASAVKKHLNLEDDPVVAIDRTNGQINTTHNGQVIDPSVLGRIAFQAARQIFVQKLREAESSTVYTQFSGRTGDIVTASVIQYEGSNLVCRLGDKAEGILRRIDQVPGESYRVGDKLRVYVTDVERKGSRVNVILSRTHENFVRRLFELEVPELQDGTVVIKAIAREPGYRTKVAVASVSDRVDCLGACVGVRGSRIKNVVDELNMENVDIVRWSDTPADLIRSALKPAEVSEVILDEPNKRATVYVQKEELSQAIGKGGRNVRLASKLAGWEIDIYELGSAEASAAAETPGQPQESGQSNDAGQ